MPGQPRPAIASSGDGAKTDRSIPSLDGLRAISIGLVILSHARGTRGFPAWLDWPPLTDHGTLGVEIFFVISGFLITSLLFEEQQQTGRISLGLFYARRTLRIFPPFYLFLAVVALAAGFGLLQVPWKNLLYAATYTMNYLAAGVWPTGHIWSLSVEEQFYLVWPSMLKLIGRRRALLAAALVAVASPVVCLAIYLVNPALSGALGRYFPIVANPIAAGCLLAGVLPWLRNEMIYFVAAPWGDLVLILIPLLDLGRNHPLVNMAFTGTATNLCICYALVRYTQFPQLRMARVLNSRVPAYIGKLSYSLYLWQQLFMNRFGDSILQTFPINIACSLACALISWYAVELPMTGLRRRFRPGAKRAAQVA